VVTRLQSSEPTINVDHRLLINFRDAVVKELGAISSYFQTLCREGKEKEDKLAHAKELMRGLKRENDDLNRRLNDLQERVSKSVPQLEYRHAKFNEL
jgi:predicted  nucleic acid-binding Zn-ribbon protein